MSLITIDPNSKSAVSGATTYVVASSVSVWSPVPARVSRDLPPAISREEAYYWTARWQNDEAESLREHAEGRSITFDSDDPDDVIRWLLAD